jgi:hypothetical protein
MIQKWTKLGLAVAAAVGIVWAQQMVVAPTGQRYLISEIQSVMVKSDSLIYQLVGGGRVAELASGTKWTFVPTFSSVAVSSSGTLSSSSSVGVSSAGGITPMLALGAIKYQIQGQNLQVESQQPVQFELLTLAGQVLHRSSGAVQQWSVNLGAAQALVLRVQGTQVSQQYLIQAR